MSKRAATHAGSWYDAKESVLASKLSSWLAEVKHEHSPATRGAICPHAGYAYCGATAAYSFSALKPSKIKRVFILGPSHHVYTTRCELSPFQRYATPLGDLVIDKQVYQQLGDCRGVFGSMDKDTDENEHSIEMQLPYIAHVMKGAQFTIVPIMVGALSEQAEAAAGRTLAPYLADPANFFVISSDFCHWGKRFSYTYYDSSKGQIWQSVEDLDRQGMAAIETQSPLAFYAYQKKFKNTICGRHPIGVFLQAVQTASQSFSLRFIHYSQSSRCSSPSDSSVSYASAVLLPAAEEEESLPKA